MKTRVANQPLAELLDQHTVVGAAELCRGEDDRIRCLACGHRCLIGEGLRGICKVRFNDAGQLKVPFGYVAGLQCDPVEKKPFFHVYPGSDALTFGMMGCDLHCSYCFPGNTPVMTNRGPLSLEEAFRSSAHVQQTADAEIAYPEDLLAVAASGNLRTVRAVFKHAYRGRLAVLRPYYLPELRCTPDHRLYATTDPAVAPRPIKAGELTDRHFLAIPRQHSFSSPQIFDVVKELEHHRPRYRVPWKLSLEERDWIAQESARGESSRAIGAALGKSASYIRHVRCKLAKGRGENLRSGQLLVEQGDVRFPNEHKPGIPQLIPLDAPFARLLGLYCAEGSVNKNKDRPNSFCLNFSFSHQERELVEDVRQLLHQTLGLQAARVQRSTTVAVAVSKASAAFLFKQLAGAGAANKRVPRQLFSAPREIVQVFLDAYREGDGHRYMNGKVSTTTVSRDLAFGIAFLALKLGFMPSIYDVPMSPESTILGRTVKRSPHQYTVVWYEVSPASRKLVETEHHYLIPVREISSIDYDGDVFNMEVEDEHNYLAGLFLVSNCQNWITSQALRDSNAVTPIRPVTPVQLIDHARREGARLVVSSYNEPLITAEWAVSVFREAHAAGIACAFVSNGNATPEVLDYLRPWIVAYKVDLKSFDDQHYRSLGGTLDNITQTIRMIHERGLWLEIVTLIIPGFNDDPDELRRAAEFLASIDRDIPWHVTAFHQDYKMTDPSPTSAETLIRAAEIGTAAGLRFIYAGNLPGKVGPWENTRCPDCRATLIERFGYLIRAYRLTADGRCPHCQTRLPGVWPGVPADVRTGNDMSAYRHRLPRPVETASQRLHALPVSQGVPSSLVKGISSMSPANAAEAPPTPASLRFPLSFQQQQDLVGSVAAMMREAVAGRPVAGPADLKEMGDHLVGGAFVTLKRGRHLRSCCGMLGQTVPLRSALEHATVRTAREDLRFPPISPTELAHLDMDVWVLRPPVRMQARGEERIAAITIGKHGLQVVRGQAQGLLLPGVAVENNWNARQFLDQVCLKAQLPPTAWKEDDTIVSTFEGESFAGRLTGMDGYTPTLGHLGLHRAGDLGAYVDFCRRELIALLTGTTPSYYLWGALDGAVNGLVLLVNQPNTEEVLHFSQVSLRPGIPLQSTLSSLIQAAARQLAAQGLRRDQVATLEIGLVVLHDPVLQGSIADPELTGHAPERAILVLERNKSALLYDPARSAEELLREAASLARVTHGKSAGVFSLAALTSASRVSISTAPQPVRGPADRPPAAAGTFYEADAEELARTIDQLLVGERGDEEWPAAMVPHAGLKYSGRIAADVLKRLRIPRTVIVIGPKHTPLGVEWAVAPHQRWMLPGAVIESDFMLARRLCEAIPGLEMDAAAHQREHAVEVELPLLARLSPESKVVGIAIGDGDLASCRRFAEGLADLLRDRPDRPLLLISSDMNHYASDAENRRLDALALAALERGDPAHLYDTVKENHISMCGLLPAVIVLETLQRLGQFRRAERTGYATSADVSGDTSRVVGYAGMLLG
jgi:AmmeMemoRadiSam system protein B/AmmeMemoRadiSam system radical SAM enzyme/AmmeMemoRadiSam system protein A